MFAQRLLETMPVVDTTTTEQRALADEVEVEVTEAEEATLA